MAETEKLLASSQNINMLAKDFQKNAHDLETEVKKASWWYCSKGCVLTFGGIGLLVVILIVILKITK